MVEQLAGNIYVYVGYWVGENFCTAPDKDVFDWFISASTIDNHLAREGHRLRKYVSATVGTVSDRESPKFVESGEIELLGNTTIVISDEEEQRGVT